MIHQPPPPPPPLPNSFEVSQVEVEVHPEFHQSFEDPLVVAFGIVFR
jgi:hypothetical protein